MRPDLLLAGEIGKPHGLSGEVYVLAISDDPSRFTAGSRLIHDNGRVLVVEGSRHHRDRLLIKFVGVGSRGEAEALRGELFVTRDDLRDLDEDEFWPHDLVGLTVVDLDGNHLGRVKRVDAGAAHDLLAIETPAGERLVPLVKDIVRSVDLSERRVAIDPPSGLLD